VGSHGRVSSVILNAIEVFYLRAQELDLQNLKKTNFSFYRTKFAALIFEDFNLRSFRRAHTSISTTKRRFEV